MILGMGRIISPNKLSWNTENIAGTFIETPSDRNRKIAFKMIVRLTITPQFRHYDYFILCYISNRGQYVTADRDSWMNDYSKANNPIRKILRNTYENSFYVLESARIFYSSDPIIDIGNINYPSFEPIFQYIFNQDEIM
jgi:hypothetical protein